MHTIVVGVSHKSASLDKRERIAFSCEDIPRALEVVGSYESIQEAVILSTCGRVELYAVSDEPDGAKEDLKNFIATYHGVALEELEGNLYCHDQAMAVSHLFSVASGLNSMVVGENQIVHQVKEAYHAAKRCKLTNRVLNALFQRSFKVAKRIRVETEIAKRPVSVSSVAVELADRTLGGLKGKTVMIVGAGKMGELTARCLVSSGASSVLVLNRTFSKAQELADRLSGRALPREALEEGLRKADVVISSAAAPHYVIKERDLRSVMGCRNGRPIFIIDIAVPRNVEPTVGSVHGVHLCNIDGLQSICSDNLVLRRRELTRCHDIIEGQTAEFMRWLKLQEVSPVISDITNHLRSTCLREVNKTLSKLEDVSDKTRRELEWLAHRIGKRLSSAPIACLKRQCALGEVDVYSMAARELFGLQSDDNGDCDWEKREVEAMNGKKKVLLVDDDADFVGATRAVLESADFEVAVAYSGEECLKEVERDKPDIIVVDVMMERMSTGFVLSRKLKKDANYSRIPILMLTSVTEKTGFRFDPKTDGPEWLPVDDYAEKPLDPAELIMRIRKLLGQKQASASAEKENG